MTAAFPPELRSDAGPVDLCVPATLLLQVDLRAQSHVNIDFRNLVQSSIPLHLSLRRDSRQIVANRWSDRGWRRELVFPAQLRARLHWLRLDLTRALHGGVTLRLSLDGVALGRLDAWPRPSRSGRFGLRRGFPGLGNLAWMTWPEGLLSLRRLPVTGTDTLFLTQHLEAGLRAPGRDVFLDLGEDEPMRRLLPPAGAAHDDPRAPVLTLVPGRIWQRSDAAGTPLILRDSTGCEVARRVLRHDDIHALLGRCDMPWLLQHDPLARLQLLEHVQFAGLWPSVPPELRCLLEAELARSTATGLAPPVPAPTRPPAPLRAPVATACDAFHQSRLDPMPTRPIAQFRSLVRRNNLTPDQVQQLALQLSEWFCLNSDPDALACAAQDFGVSGWDRIAEPWGRIAALPMLWANGNWSDCLQVLQTTRRTRPDWVVTPALGWLARALAQNSGALDGARPDPAMRVSLAQALLELIADLAPDYMSQMGCKALMDAVLDLLAAAVRFPDWCLSRFCDLALQAYGLNADFWCRPAHCLPAALHPWQSAFAALHAACLSADQAMIHTRARPFLIQPIAGRELLRRFALSNQAWPAAGDGLPDPNMLTGIASPPQIEEAALRWLAFPRSGNARAQLPLDPESPVQRAACAGLRAAAGDIRRPSLSRAQLQLGRITHALLRDLRNGGQVAPAAQRAALDAAQALLRPEAGFVGLSALLSLAEAFARNGEDMAARCCIAALRDNLRGGDPGAMRATPAVALALARFETLCPDPALRAQLRDLLPADPALAPPVSEERRLAALRKWANPFADTLVALISCHANLTTRVPDIRATWGRDLTDHAIPLITVVGRAPGQRPGCGAQFDGRILQLDAPDDYEGLPQKTLALADWVLKRTGFGRVFKIDDDCFLDVEAFFTDPVFLNIPYYGRPLYRGKGSMDRAWHMGHARSARGRFELDKSPEPALYADGGSGYMLNRPALAALGRASESPEGQALEQVSFMEDKLVGDLLAGSGITVAGPGYDVSVFRRAGRDLPATPQYQAGFLPFAGAGVKLAHLDKGASQQDVRAGRDAPWPSPMTLWPLHRSAGLGWAKHGLSLLSPPERLERAASARCAVVSVMRNEAFMIAHFLDHYRRLGVDGFLIVDNGSDDGTLDYLASQPDVAVFTTDTPYRLSAYGVMWQEALLAQLRAGKWSLLADADELLFWSLPDAAGHVRGDLPELLARPDFTMAEAVRVFMFDLYPAGPLSDAQFTSSPFLEAGHIDRDPLCRDWQGRGPWSNSATVTSALRHRLMREAGAAARANLFVAQKYALLRYHPFMQLSTGLHYIAGARVAERELGFAHFKYHAQFHAKALREAARGEHFNNAEEYRNYLALQAEGQAQLYRPDLSVTLAECPSVRAVCDIPEPVLVAMRRKGASGHAQRARRRGRYHVTLPPRSPAAAMVRAM